MINNSVLLISGISVASRCQDLLTLTYHAILKSVGYQCTIRTVLYTCYLWICQNQDAFLRLTPMVVCSIWNECRYSSYSETALSVAAVDLE